MNAIIVPAPIRRSVVVNADPATAFRIFTARMGAWWPKSHSVNPQTTQADVVVEPKVGGRWFERGADGSESPWGHVMSWDPPGRLLLGWQLDADWQFDPDRVTEVEVRFMPQADGTTLVELEHRNLERFGDRAEEVAAGIGSPQGWGGMLAAFAGLAAG